MSLLVILVALFLISGGVFDWDWVMNHHNANVLIKMFGRKGARIFYILLGLVLVISQVWKIYSNRN